MHVLRGYYSKWALAPDFTQTTELKIKISGLLPLLGRGDSRARVSVLFLYLLLGMGFRDFLLYNSVTDSGFQFCLCTERRKYR